MKNSAVVLTTVVATAVGVSAGMFIQKYRALKNTPEAVILKLETAKEESKQAKKDANDAEAKNRAAYSQLLATEAKFKAEVRDEIEAKVRKELADYISKADETYEKAKKENELAELKMEIAKSNAPIVKIDKYNV